MENENTSYEPLITEQHPTVNYLHERLVLRLDVGLLEMFICSRCNEVACDPLGRDGKHQHLCEACADGVPPTLEEVP